MFKERYKKANDSITDDALKEKILHPQPVKTRSFVPAYSYGTICAGVLAVVLLFSSQAKDTEKPQVTGEIPPVKYEYKGERFAVNMQKTKMAENSAVAVAEMSLEDAVYDAVYDAPCLCKSNSNVLQNTYKTSLTPTLENINITSAETKKGNVKILQSTKRQ